MKGIHTRDVSIRQYTITRNTKLNNCQIIHVQQNSLIRQSFDFCVYGCFDHNWKGPYITAFLLPSQKPSHKPSNFDREALNQKPAKSLPWFGSGCYQILAHGNDFPVFGQSKLELTTNKTSEWKRKKHHFKNHHPRIIPKQHPPPTTSPKHLPTTSSNNTTFGTTFHGQVAVTPIWLVLHHSAGPWT